MTRDEFLAAMTLEPVELAVDGLGTVKVRGLTLIEFDRVRRVMAENQARGVIEAVAAGLVEPALTREELERAPMHLHDTLERVSVRIAELSAGPLLTTESAEALENLAGGGS